MLIITYYKEKVNRDFNKKQKKDGCFMNESMWSILSGAFLITLKIYIDNSIKI